jgi:hypothetical protein
VAINIAGISHSNHARARRKKKTCTLSAKHKLQLHLTLPEDPPGFDVVKGFFTGAS